MNKIIKKAGKIFLILVVIISAFYVISVPVRNRKSKKTYTTSSGTMLIGGMASDKNKIEDFKKSLENDKAHRKFWDYIHMSSAEQEKKDYEKAIFYENKALEAARGKGDEFQARMGLARLYEQTKQYKLALEQYDWLLDYSNRPDVIAKLKESQARVQTLLKEQSGE